jgi:hypothetical protein
MSSTTARKLTATGNGAYQQTTDSGTIGVQRFDSAGVSPHRKVRDEYERVKNQGTPTTEIS